MAKADLYMVIESFSTTIAGDEVEYHKGEIVEGDDPAIRKRPNLFGPIQLKHRRNVVEQATAAPGEMR